MWSTRNVCLNEEKWTVILCSGVDKEQIWEGGHNFDRKKMVPFVQQSSCSFCHDIEVLPGELQKDGEVLPILFPSPYLTQHFSIPHSKKPPPKHISGHSSHTKNIIITFNGVPLDTFNASFVHLSERCKKFCSNSRLFSRKLTQFSPYFMCMCS